MDEEPNECRPPEHNGDVKGIIVFPEKSVKQFFPTLGLKREDGKYYYP